MLAVQRWAVAGATRDGVLAAVFRRLLPVGRPKPEPRNHAPLPCPCPCGPTPQPSKVFSEKCAVLPQVTFVLRLGLKISVTYTIVNTLCPYSTRLRAEAIQGGGVIDKQEPDGNLYHEFMVLTHPYSTTAIYIN